MSVSLNAVLVSKNVIHKQPKRQFCEFNIDYTTNVYSHSSIKLCFFIFLKRRSFEISINDQIPWSLKLSPLPPGGYVWYIGYFSALMVCVMVLTVSCVLVHRFRDQQRERHTHFWVAAIEQGAVTQHPLLHWIDVNRHLSLSVIVKGDARGKQEEDREEGEEGKKEEGSDKDGGQRRVKRERCEKVEEEEEEEKDVSEIEKGSNRDKGEERGNREREEDVGVEMTEMTMEERKVMEREERDVREEEEEKQEVVTKSS